MTMIEERALQSEGNGPLPWRSLQPTLWSEHLGKMRAPSRAPETALKVFVSVPSLLPARSSIDTLSVFPRSLNNAG